MTPENPQDIWAYLSASPLLGLTITLLAYSAGDWIYQKAGRNPMASPMIPAMVIVISFLSLTGIDYPTYFEGAQFVHFLLGPATVALAIPLYNNLGKVKKSLLAIAIALPVGSLVAILSAIAIAHTMGAPDQMLLSLAPKSVTSPIAMGITERLGGLPSLTAVIVVMTGILGTILMVPILKICRIKQHKSMGLAMGVSAHGIGTAQAIQVSEEAGAFAGIGMALNGVATAIFLPILFGYLW